jgi:hypothetical protein
MGAAQRNPRPAGEHRGRAGIFLILAPSRLFLRRPAIIQDPTISRRQAEDALGVVNLT